MGKILLSLIGAVILSGCTDLSNEEVAYIEGKEDIDFVVEKEVYTCNNEEFFYVEQNSSKNIVNFMYGNYSTALSQKPAIESKIFSDGIYKLTFKNDLVNVVIGKELILEDCKKTL